MPILTIQPNAVDTANSYTFGNVSATNVTANGTNLGTAVAQAFLLANTANKSTTSNTAPSNPNVGDTWFDTVTGVLLRYTNDGVSNNWIDISGTTNAGYIYQTYSITPNTASINETTGNTVIYTVATTNTADNTVLYWTSSGTTVASDFSDSANSGNVTIINNSGTITRSLSADATTEGSETIILSLRTGSTTGPVVAVASSVTIVDTSQTPFMVDYLVVAGGGAGGSYYGGGGGAGGLLTSTNYQVLKGIALTVTVGAGGTGIAATVSTPGANGSNSVFDSVTAFGGGGGGAYDNVSGRPGGSGGGGGGMFQDNLGDNPGQGTAGQGYAGGQGGTVGYGDGGGGGGAGGVGGDKGPRGLGTGGDGGPGVSSSMSGTSVIYATGGGGAGYFARGYGGSSSVNGGDGFYNAAMGPATSASVNTGGGGGGVADNVNYTAGSGGSGVVIVRYSNTEPDATTTGTVTFTNTGGYKIYKFTSSGTITFN